MGAGAERRAQVARPVRVKQENKQATPQSKPTGRRPTGTRPAAPQRAARQRGPRFFATFGIMGVVFAVLLIFTTISRYTTNHNDYPHKLSAYTAARLAYEKAVAQHAHILPKAPGAAPIAPTLSASDFFLPALYLVLSLAYLGLAYRANRMRRLQAAST